MESVSDRTWSISLLILLISADLVFICLEILYSLGYASEYKFSLGAERGYAEVYQYVKLFWIVLILLWFVFKMYQPVYGIGALLFFYFLLDDSLEIHETFGGHIVKWAGLVPAFGLRAQDFGELAVYALIGTFFLLAGWVAYKHSDALAKQASLYLLAGVIGLAVFGAGADMLHSMLEDRFPWTNTPMVILEDGGEMIVVSVICWFVYSLAIQKLSQPLISSPFAQDKYTR